MEKRSDLSPAERRRRLRRNTLLDILLRQIALEGLESLEERNWKFLKRVAAELRDELEWEGPVEPS